MPDEGLAISSELGVRGMITHRLAKRHYETIVLVQAETARTMHEVPLNLPARPDAATELKHWD